MLGFLFKRDRRLQTLICSYLDCLDKAKENFSRAFHSGAFDYRCEAFQFYLEQTHKYESRADDIREDIKDFMYGKALIPESRGDIMGLIENLDELPGLFEDVLYSIQIQQLLVPECIRQDLGELVNFSLESVELVAQEVSALFNKSHNINELANAIDQNESHCDHIERRMITTVFRSELDSFNKLQLKDLIGLLGTIPDQADRVSRRIHIINIKRRV